MKKLLGFFTIFSLLISSVLQGQVQQTSQVQSQGGSVQASGIYEHTVIIGEPVSSGIFNGSVFAGSSYGFLSNSNAAPVADAGEDNDVVAGDLVKLDGSGSTDPDGTTTLTYQWTSLDGVILTDTNTVQPTFTAPDVACRRAYRFELEVSDGQLSSKDEVTITVSNPDWIPVVYTNSASMIASVSLDNIPAEEGDLLGAFVNGECRGVADIFIVGETAFASFNIQAETTVNVSFRVCDQSPARICDVFNTLSITPGSSYGSPENPIDLDATCGDEGLICEDVELTLTTDISDTQEFNASEKITATNTITSMGDAIYTAGDSIVLEQGFSATGNFHAYIADCDFLPNNTAIESRASYTETNKNADLKIFPNPASQNATIRFYLPESTNVLLQLIDINGKIIHTQSLSNLSSGWQESDINVLHYSPGIYGVRLQTPSIVLARKLSIVPE